MCRGKGHVYVLYVTENITNTLVYSVKGPCSWGIGGLAQMLEPMASDISTKIG